MDLRRWFARIVLLCGLAVLVGCARKPPAQQTADSQQPPAQPSGNLQPKPSDTLQPSEKLPPTGNKSQTAGTRPTTRPAYKPASELKIPAGLEEPPSEMKASQSSWEYIAHAQVGDYAELEMSGMRIRTEIFDIADRAVVQIMEMTAQPGEQPMRSVSKMLFTEPELDPQDEHYVKFEKQPSRRKFTIGGKEYQADTVTNGYKDGKLVSKTWTSKQVTIGSLLMEDGEGKVTSRLISFGRK